MAVRFDSDGESYTRSLGLGSQTQWSITCWVKLSVNRGDFHTAWSLDNGDADMYVLQTDGGTTMAVWDENLSTLAVRSFTVGTWYFFGVSVNGSNGTMTSRGQGDTAFQTATWSSGSGTTNLANLRLGDDAIPFFADWLDGCLAAVKLWVGATLTAAELQQEAWTYQPRRTANLRCWYPLLTPETVDYSGNSQTLTGGSGTTTEDGPPISWGPVRRRLVAPPLIEIPVDVDESGSAADALSVTKTRALDVAESGAADDALTIEERMQEPSEGGAVPTRAPYYSTPAVTVHIGDCLDVLRGMPDESVDAVVTDPPYGLAKLNAAKVVDAVTAWASGDRARVPDGRGFMGREWDRFVPPPAVWDECLRVLKPGGHLLVFAGARTFDLMGLAIRMAAAEIRDTLQWLYGSGFPKSLDVAKTIDKAAGHWRGRAGAVTTDNGSMTGANYERTPKGNPITAEAARWDGWGTALKPAWEPIIMARKPLSGTVAANVVRHGTGGINIDGCRFGGTVETWPQTRSYAPGQMQPGGQGATQETGEAPPGRWPANVVLSHAPACDEGGDCAEGCPVPELDAQSGFSKSQRRLHRTNKSGDILAFKPLVSVRGHDDEGGASRFFPTFRYTPKAPASERPRLPDGTAHPTVKPLALMRWLVRLVTPPGGLVLDPFAGSGTTGEAALLEGCRSVLIELDDKHCELIRLRLDKHTGEIGAHPAGEAAGPGPGAAVADRAAVSDLECVPAAPRRGGA